jgi:hypothetical protein
MHIMTIVRVSGSLRGMEGACSELSTAPEVISWVHMAHFPNEPYGPLQWRLPEEVRRGVLAGELM